MALFLLLPMGSCHKDSGKSLIGTKWTKTSGPGVRYILEFTSQSDVRLFEADEYNDYKSGLLEDTYSFSDGIVSFDKKSLRIMKFSGSTVTGYYFQNATVSEDVMKVQTKGVEVQADLSEETTPSKEVQGVYVTFEKL